MRGELNGAHDMRMVSSACPFGAHAMGRTQWGACNGAHAMGRMVATTRNQLPAGGGGVTWAAGTAQHARKPVSTNMARPEQR